MGFDKKRSVDSKEGGRGTFSEPAGSKMFLKEEEEEDIIDMRLRERGSKIVGVCEWYSDMCYSFFSWGCLLRRELICNEWISAS